jgi:hypothetical protein
MQEELRLTVFALRTALVQRCLLDLRQSNVFFRDLFEYRRRREQRLVTGHPLGLRRISKVANELRGLDESEIHDPLDFFGFHSAHPCRIEQHPADRQKCSAPQRAKDQDHDCCETSHVTAFPGLT